MHHRSLTSPTTIAAIGAGVVSAVVGIISLRHLSDPGAMYRVVGAAVYIAGLLVTVAYHVPHNDALACVDANGLGAVRTWATYATGWTAWNHVRAAAAIAGAVLLVVANRAADRAVAA